MALGDLRLCPDCLHYLRERDEARRHSLADAGKLAAALLLNFVCRKFVIFRG